MVRSAARRCTDTSSTRGAATATSSPAPHGSTPKVERSHRIDSEKFYRLLEEQVIDDARLFTEKLKEWEDYNNHHRPHEALGGQTPYECLRQETQDPLS